MSIAVMTDVWKYSKAAGTDLLVLLALADNANDEGECWPSIGYIAKKCRIDTRTTQRRIRSLETIGEVVVIRGGGSASTAGGTRSNRYRIIVHIPEEQGGGDLPGGGIGARDGVALVPGDGVALVPPEPSLEPSGNHLAPAGADAAEVASLHQAILSALGIADVHSLTKSRAGSIGKKVREIFDAGGRADQVDSELASLIERFPDAEVTEGSLAKYWGTRAKSGSRSPSPTTKPWTDLTKAEKAVPGLCRSTMSDAEVEAEIADKFGDGFDFDEAMAIYRRMRHLEAVGF